VTPDEQAFEAVLAMLRRAKSAAWKRNWKATHWSVAHDSWKAFKVVARQQPAWSDWGPVSIWGIPVRDELEVGLGWWLCFDNAQPQPADALAKDQQGLSVTLSADSSKWEAGMAAAAQKLSYLWPSGADPDDAGDADLSQIEADVKALAAKNPDGPAATLDGWDPTTSYFLHNMVMAAQKPAPFLAPTMASVAEAAGIISAGNPLVPPEPDQKALDETAAAIQQAANQIAMSLINGVLPVPALAHHAKVGDFAVHLEVTITKETHLWKP